MMGLNVQYLLKIKAAYLFFLTLTWLRGVWEASAPLDPLVALLYETINSE